MENGENFTLYMPETPIEQLSEDFLAWWPSWYYSRGGDCQTRETFPVMECAMRQCNTDFFSYEGMDAFEPYISK